MPRSRSNYSTSVDESVIHDAGAGGSGPFYPPRPSTIDASGSFRKWKIGVVLFSGICFIGLFGWLIGKWSSTVVVMTSWVDGSDLDLGQADVIRSLYGIAHIRANSWEDLSFALGFAQAEDRLCDMADAVNFVRAERSMHFGLHKDDQNYGSDAGLGNCRNLKDDMLSLMVGWRRRGEELWVALTLEEQTRLQSFAQGYNSFLKLGDYHGGYGVRWCNPKGENGRRELMSFVTPISGIDVLSYQLSFQSALYVPGELLIGGVPPEEQGKALHERVIIEAGPTFECNNESWKVDYHNDLIIGNGIGSNAVAVGSERGRNGNVALLANPHFALTGPLAFHMFHLMSPELNVMGASPVLFPVVLIGANDNVAFSHTVATSTHDAYYQVKVKEEIDHRWSYKMDGMTELIESYKEQLTMKINGRLVEAHFDRYVSKWGPVVSGIGKVDMTWTDSQLYSWADANLNNVLGLRHSTGFNEATDIADISKTMETTGGIAFCNTVAVDIYGESLYADTTPIPRAKHKQVADSWQNGEEFCAAGGDCYLLEPDNNILPGNTDVFATYNDPSTTFYGKFPMQTSLQVLQNSNNTYWLADPTNPDNSIENKMYGYTEDDTKYGVLPRPRQAMVTTRESCGIIDYTTLSADVMFSNRSILIEDVIEHLRFFVGEGEYCDGQEERNPKFSAEVCHALTLILDGAERDRCNPLSKDLTIIPGLFNTDTRGGFFAMEIAAQMYTHPDKYKTPFSPEDPIYTPSGYLRDQLVLDIQKSELVLTRGGVEVDATLGSVQVFDARVMDEDSNVTELLVGAPGANQKAGCFNHLSGSRKFENSMRPWRGPVEIVQGSEAGLTTDGKVYVYEGPAMIMITEKWLMGGKLGMISPFGQSEDLSQKQYSLSAGSVYASSLSGQVTPAPYLEDEVKDGVQGAFKLTRSPLHRLISE